MSNLVTVRPIRTEEDYEAALTRVGDIIGAMPGTQEFDELDVLATLVQQYERTHHPLPPADPVAAVKSVMNEKGLRPADLVPYFGAQSRVSDFLNGKRGLSIEQIRRLRTALCIPLECLIAESVIASRTG